MVHGDEEYVWGRVMGWDPIGRYTQEFWLGHPEDEATVLDVRFTEAEAGGSRVRLVHSGWMPRHRGGPREVHPLGRPARAATPPTCRDPASSARCAIDDLAACEAITRDAYYEVDRAHLPARRGPIPHAAVRRRPRRLAGEAAPQARHRSRRLLGGRGRRRRRRRSRSRCVRELMWILCSFAVAPEAQGAGSGPCCSTRRPATARLPARHVRREPRPGRAAPLPPGRLRPAPADGAHGAPSTATVLPVVPHVREGTAADRDLCD